MHHVAGVTKPNQVTGNVATDPGARGPLSQFRPAMSPGNIPPHHHHLLFLTLILLVANFLPTNSENQSPRVVTTKYGKLRGIIHALPNKHLKSVEKFLGVPYANPPLRSNRFSPTRTPNPWAGVKTADQYRPVCPQRLPDLWDESVVRHMPRSRLHFLRRLKNYFSNQDEDCLYLNVYVPSYGE